MNRVLWQTVDSLLHEAVTVVRAELLAEAANCRTWDRIVVETDGTPNGRQRIVNGLVLEIIPGEDGRTKVLVLQRGGVLVHTSRWRGPATSEHRQGRIGFRTKLTPKTRQFWHDYGPKAARTFDMASGRDSRLVVPMGLHLARR